jgi:Tfp pilus assembly PilM family ATPase
MSETSASLQNPYWAPIYSQEVLFSEDQLKTHIHHPKNTNLTEDKIARSGKLNSVDINYFDRQNTTLNPLKHRFPFFY